MSKLKAVAAYVYAGNFSLGVGKHFEIMAHLEDPRPYGQEVIDLNRGKYWDNFMPVYPYPWPVIGGDLLFANPPCAPFSNANAASFIRDSWKSDPRIECWYNTVNYGLNNGFPFVAIETVPQAYSKAPSLLEDVMERFNENGYQVIIFLHNASLMGSCQNRPRILFLASKYQIEITPYLDYPRVTVGDILNGVKSIKNDFQISCSPKYQPLLKETRVGERMRDAWNRLHPEETRVLNEKGQVSGRPTFGVIRVNPETQCGVIVGYSIIHPEYHRYLTLREYQALGDFPVGYSFPHKTSALSYVARGVSSRVGEWLGKCAAVTLKNRKRILKNTPIKLIHNGLNGWKNRVEHNLDDYMSFPILSLRSKFDQVAGYRRPSKTAIFKNNEMPDKGTMRRRRSTFNLSHVPTFGQASKRSLRHVRQILVTGMTARHIGGGKNKYLTIIEPLLIILRDYLKLRVTQREVHVGEDLSEYDKIIVFLFPPEKLGATRRFGALDVLARYPEKVVIAFDDWQYYQFQSMMNSCLNSGRYWNWVDKHPGFISKADYNVLHFKSGDRAGRATRARLEKIARDLIGNVKFPIIFPQFAWGDKSKIRLSSTGKIFLIDPSIICMDILKNGPYAKLSHPKNRKKIWTLGSLFDYSKYVDSLDLQWPVKKFGYKKTQTVITEPALSFAYSENWGIISPRYITSGDGWWRMRWVFSAYYNNIIHVDIDERGALPESFLPPVKENIEYPNTSVKKLSTLASNQAQILLNRFMPREEIIETIQGSLLERI